MIGCLKFLCGCSGNIYNHGEADHGWVYDSSISPGDGEDYSYSQQPVDGYECSEMDNPLNQMVPIPVSFLSLEWLMSRISFFLFFHYEKSFCYQCGL